MNEIRIKESVVCKRFVTKVRVLQNYKQFKKNFILMHIANESVAGLRWGVHLKALGVVAGAPDYIVMYEGGKVAAIEFKRDAKARLSDTQKMFKENCEKLNIPYLNTFDIEEAIEFLQNI